MPDESQPIVADAKPAPIEEPPLKNQKSLLRRGCSFLFSCLAVLAVMLILIGWLWGSPSPNRVASLPADFPTDIPLYRFEDRATIAYVLPEQNDSNLARLAILSRSVGASLLKKTGLKNFFEAENFEGPVQISFRNFWPDMKKIMTAPVNGRQKEKATIVWENLEEKKETAYNFYKKNLKAQEYKITEVNGLTTFLSLSFQKNDVSGRLQIEKIAGKEELNIILEAEYLKK